MGGKRITIQDCQELAKSNKGWCLSTEYINSSSPLNWKCEHGHCWPASYNSVQTYKNRKGTWCKTCADLDKCNTIEDCDAIALLNGGKCLTRIYKNRVTDMKWECRLFHTWDTSFEVVQKGSWCPKCAGNTLDDCHEEAKIRNGECLSTEYVGVEEKMIWRCHKRHIFYQSLHAVRKHHWCPDCNQKFGERLTRYVFEKMLLRDFKKERPDWLVNPKTGYRLELDGYNEQMNIAFEHQGVQHEVDLSTDHPMYNAKQIDRDEIKRQKCKEQGIVLIEVPEVRRRLKINDLVPFILSEFDKYNIPYPESAKSFEIDWTEFNAQYKN